MLPKKLAPPPAPLVDMLNEAFAERLPLTEKEAPLLVKPLPVIEPSTKFIATENLPESVLPLKLPE